MMVTSHSSGELDIIVCSSRPKEISSKMKVPRLRQVIQVKKRVSWFCVMVRIKNAFLLNFFLEKSFCVQCNNLIHVFSFPVKLHKHSSLWFIINQCPNSRVPMSSALDSPTLLCELASEQHNVLKKVWPTCFKMCTEQKYSVTIFLFCNLLCLVIFLNNYCR